MVSRCHSAGKHTVEGRQRRARLAAGPCPLPGCRPPGPLPAHHRTRVAVVLHREGGAGAKAPKQVPPHAAGVHSVTACARRAGRGTLSPWCHLWFGSVRSTAAQPGQVACGAGTPSLLAALRCAARPKQTLVQQTPHPRGAAASSLASPLPFPGDCRPAGSGRLPPVSAP